MVTKDTGDGVPPEHVPADDAPADDVDRIVAQWDLERPELETLPMAVFGRIYRIARLVGDQQERIYTGLGMNRGEFDVLATLRRSGAPFQLSPKQLATTMMLTTGGMTGRLDRLEGRGLIARSPDPADRRGLVITLTPAGLEAIDRAIAPGLAAQRAVLGALPPEKAEELSGLLRILLASAHRSGAHQTGADETPT